MTSTLLIHLQAPDLCFLLLLTIQIQHVLPTFPHSLFPHISSLSSLLLAISFPAPPFFPSYLNCPQREIKKKCLSYIKDTLKVYDTFLSTIPPLTADRSHSLRNLRKPSFLPRKSIMLYRFRENPKLEHNPS